MHEIRIEDPDDPRLDDYRGLTDTALRMRRDVEQGLYIAESRIVIERAIRAGHRPRSVLVQERRVASIRAALAGVDADVYVAPDAIMDTVAGFPVHRGALAAMHRPPLPAVGDLLALARTRDRSKDPVGCDDVVRSTDRTPRRRSRVAIFDSLVDHANVGAGFRSAAALGVDAVLLTPTCADPLYRRSIRVSMGTVFQVPWTRIDAWPAGIGQLRDAGYLVAGLTLESDSITLDELIAQDHPHLALVFGTEGHGLAPSVVSRLDRKVIIPMTGGVDSLNVAASAAVVFYATR